MEAGLGLQRGNRGIGVARNHVPAIQQGDGHVLSVSRIADDHLIVGFKALQSQILHLEAFVRRSLSRNDGGIADQRVVDPRIWNQVRLEFVEIDIQRAIES